MMPRGSNGKEMPPTGIMEAAQAYWLGIDVNTDGPDLDVVGYATDGRPEPKVAKPQHKRSLGDRAAASVSKLGFNDDDDYEDHDLEPESTGEEILKTAKRLGRLVSDYVRQTSKSIRNRFFECGHLCGHCVLRTPAVPNRRQHRWP